MTKRLFFAWALASAAGLSAAPAAQVRGRITVADRPVAGVTVSAVPYETPFEEERREARGAAESPAVATATSAADGTFALALPHRRRHGYSPHGVGPRRGSGAPGAAGRCDARRRRRGHCGGQGPAPGGTCRGSERRPRGRGHGPSRCRGPDARLGHDRDHRLRRLVPLRECERERQPAAHRGARIRLHGASGTALRRDPQAACALLRRPDRGCRPDARQADARGRRARPLRRRRPLAMDRDPPGRRLHRRGRRRGRVARGRRRVGGPRLRATVVVEREGHRGPGAHRNSSGACDRHGHGSGGPGNLDRGP